MQNNNFGIISHYGPNHLRLLYRIVIPVKMSHHQVRIITFIAYDAQSICTLILLHRKVYESITVSHGFYLARELTKAEFALVLQQQYRQD